MLLVLLLSFGMASSDVAEPAPEHQDTLLEGPSDAPDIINALDIHEGELELSYRAPLPEISYISPTSTYSQGCKVAAQEPLSTLTVNAIERHFLSYIPEDYDASQAYQLIIAFHGRTGSNAEVQEYFALESFANSSIIVYPSGLDDPHVQGARTWSDKGDTGDALRDYAFFDALLSYFTEHYCIDQERVFAVGHSLGASFVNSLACARADVLTGIASLAGGVYSSRSIEAGCSEAIAMLIMHNPHDEHVPFAMGEQVLELYLDQHHNSQAIPEPVTIASLESFACQSYDANTPLVWCPHQQDYIWNGRYYPHGWMSGMGEAVMTFFAAVE